MKREETTGPDEPELEDGELVDENDEIIGKAFRGSLVVLAGAAALGGVLWFVFGREEEALAPIEVAVEAPRTVEQDLVVPAIPFTDVTRAAGIDFVHENGARGAKLLPETMGGGSAFFDLEGDGDPDLLLTNGRPWPEDVRDGEAPATMALFVNDGRGRFENVTKAAGLALSFYGMGVAVGDVDCDGDPDLFFTAVGTNKLFLNDGNVFHEVEAGVAGSPEDWSTCAAFFDADGDGDLDLYVGNYVRWSRDIDFEIDYRLTGIGRSYGPPVNFGGSHAYFYENDGTGRFEDVSEAAGVRVENPATGDPIGKALGVLPLDADEDGDVDLLVANDTVQNFWFENRGDGTFEEHGSLAGVAFDRNGNSTGAMGIDAGHYRNDDALGFAIGNFANEMTSLYVRQSSGVFADEAIGEGIGAPTRLRLSFGVFFFDADLDGRLDLLSANGHLEDEIQKVQASQSYEQPAQLFWNAGPQARRTFLEVPEDKLGDLTTPVVGRGASYADIDGDGDLDVLLTQTGRRPMLFRNDQTSGHHWLRVQVVGSRCNPDAVGARVLLEANGLRQTRSVMPCRSYLAYVEPTVTFGLGDATSIEALTVRWPDGHERSFQAVPVDGLFRAERE